jgi:CBS-domain-containing membrane protein
MSNVLVFPVPNDAVTQRREYVRALCQYVSQHVPTLGPDETFRISTVVIDELTARFSKLDGWQDMSLNESIELLVEFHRDTWVRSMHDLLALEVLKSGVDQATQSHSY